MRTEHMTVLVLGSGAREHALYWACKKSPKVGRVLVAPGNGGIDPEDRRDFKLYQQNVLAYVCKTEQVDLVIIGPEDPLVAGVVGFLAKQGIAAFGPTFHAANLEGSKAFTKLLCREEGIPTAPFGVFTDYDAAECYIESMNVPPVIKASGLCAGKGVVVADSFKQAMDAAYAMLVTKVHGAAGSTIVVEERISGRECSVMAFCDGVNAVLLPPARDYKRAFDGDTGPNTGGMGACSPVPDVDETMLARVKLEIIEPTLRYMERVGNPFHGLLYAGIMVTNDGPVLFEYNVRFGDPEAQVVLPRIESDIVEYMLATIETGGLADLPPLQVAEGAAVGVTLAMEGYPTSYKTGSVIADNRLEEGATLLFIGGAERDESAVLRTTGGRVATLVARDETLADARAHAYRVVEDISFDGMFYRTDIAAGL